MKIIKYAIVITLLWSNLNTQGQPSGSLNYVMTNTVKQAGVTNEGMIPGLPIAIQGKSQTIGYVDGLGRPIQSIVTQGSATQKDIIAGNEYDAFGREVKKYLPYADINNTAKPGSYKTGWQTTQAGFYNGQLQGVDVDAAPYSQSVIEASPLNRIQAQGAPGTVWQPNLGDAYDASKKIIQIKYEINVAADNVRIFNVDNTNGNISSPSAYDVGLLNVKRSIDEHGGVTKEFMDKSGHMILKQVYLDNDVLQTYYIYDDLDLLRAVIQPEGVGIIPATGTWTPDAPFTSNWMFLYSYDSRNRMVSKQVPGAAMVYMVYDQWDRLVLTQDGNLRVNKQWLYTKYDALNRPVVTGVITDNNNTTLAAMQSAVMASTGRFETVNTSANEGYTLNGSFPSSGSYALTVYTTIHYDSYVNLPSWSSGYGFVSENGVTAYNNNLQGQVVGTQTRILGTSNYLRTVSYFDDKYRPIQSTSDNAAGGKDRITRVLTFDGKPSQEYQTHTSNFYSSGIVTNKTYTYDHVDRLLKVTHQIGTGEVVTLIENSYNEMGQLLNKKLHQAASYTNSAYLQKLDYAYNIRGWLNSINKPDPASVGYDETDLFNFELHYNNASLGATAQFNGNIAEQVWKGGYDEYFRGYKYGYDKANRLMTSDYGFKYLNAYNSPVWDFSMKYNENVTMYNSNNILVGAYDKNGNIKHLERFHGSWNRVDDLYYDYKDWNTSGAPVTGNRLTRVTDNIYSGSPVGFKDVNSSSGGNDYTFDANGNLITDLNKGITSITYNHLNLPTLVNFGTAKGKIEYLYDAGGNKMQKTVTDMSVSPNKITITKYAGAFVYTNSYFSTASPIPAETLEFIAHEEGRIRPTVIDPAQPLTAANTKYIYDYFMKDHLGNTRMVLTTEQQTDVYAATQEPANATKENQLFANLSSTTITKPGGFDAVSANTQVSRVNGGAANTRIGPSIILKVMAGDIISIGAKAWYQGTTQAPVSAPSPIKDQLLNLLTNGVVGNNGTHGGSILVSDINSANSGILDDFLGSQVYDDKRPKAFLNWMIVDEEFKKVTSSFHSGSVQVPPITGTMQAVQLTQAPANMTVRRNGWLYVYLSNESNQDVYFDDLIINQKRGPVIQGTDYYAFGMEIPGLSTKAIGFGGNNENRRKFNGGNELQSKEFSDGSGLEWYDATNRMYDPQIGRFGQIDELGEVVTGWSPYSFSYNNPVNFNDPLGLEAEEYTSGGKKRKKEIRTEGTGSGNAQEVLNNFTVTARHTTPNLINSYWFYRLHGGGLSNAPKDIQNWLDRYDITQQWLEKLHKSQREDDRAIAEFALLFVPIPGFGELGIAGKLGNAAVKLFKFRRGAVITEKIGVTVLGHLGEYEEVARRIGGDFLSVAKKDYSPSLNAAFIEKSAASGDTFYLTTAVQDVRAGSMLGKEIDRLIKDLGYKIINNGFTLVK